VLSAIFANLFFYLRAWLMKSPAAGGLKSSVAVLNAAVHWKGASQRMRPIAAERSSSAANGAVGARMRPL